MIRIAAFGDVHGNLVALQAVLADMERLGVDARVCLGDLAFRGPRPAECVALVRSLGVPCVHGNTDLMLLFAAGDRFGAGVPEDCRAPAAAGPWLRWHLDRLPASEMEYLRGLPFAYRMEADGQRLLFVHATPQDCTSTLGPGDAPEEVEARLQGLHADWLVMGHIHRAFAFRQGGVQLVNAGAVGFSLDGDPRAAYALLDVARGDITLRRVTYDVERALADVDATGFCFPRAEVELALRHGRWPTIPWEERTWGGP